MELLPCHQGNIVINSYKKVILCGPSLLAVSGVSTHLNQLLNSSLSNEFNLLHFQVGSEGRGESKFGKAWRLFSSPVYFSKFILDEKPSLILLNTSLEPKSFWRDLVYLFVAKLLKKKVIYQVHGGELPEKFLGTGIAAQWFIHLCLKIPDAIILLAEIEKKSYQKFNGIKNITVIPNAVDIAEYSHLKPKNYENKKLKLGYIGRLADDKGIIESIYAINLLNNTNKINFEYLVVGSGPIKGELQSLIKSLELDDTISLLPPVFGREKTGFWEDIDVFLFPTYHREGLPYTVLESIASGTPIITSKVGGIPDVITDSVQGIFVDPHSVDNIAEAIEQLVSDRKTLSEMSVAAIKRAHENYTIERLASQFSDLFHRVLKE